VPNPAEVLGSQRMQQLVKELNGVADILIFDTPPLLAVTDAQVVGHLVDGALLAINSQKTPAGAVHRGLQTLAQVNVPVMGAVLNRLSGSGRAYYYYHQYYTQDYRAYAACEDDEGGQGGGGEGGRRGGARRSAGQGQAEPVQRLETLPAHD
jgi:Mrp family chromosome partitioning ATPase